MFLSPLFSLIWSISNSWVGADMLSDFQITWRDIPWSYPWVLLHLLIKEGTGETQSRFLFLTNPVSLNWKSIAHLLLFLSPICLFSLALQMAAVPEAHIYISYSFSLKVRLRKCFIIFLKAANLHLSLPPRPLKSFWMLFYLLTY